MPASTPKSYRKIIHVDMDAFYASVEQNDHPELKGKPLAVGGSGKRGVVAAASYEARKYGVRSAMPSVTAVRKCPELIFVPPRFDRYKEVSNQIREIFFEYTDLVEPLSLDEAYLDVTENKMQIQSAIKIAMEIREKIKAVTALTASAGVSFNKFLAKTASDLDKPDGLSVILPEQAAAFLDELAIEKFHGIGKVTAAKMKNQGIFKGSDLKQLSKEQLTKRYGKVGLHYYKIVHGLDERAVKPNRERKSVGAENTFRENVQTEEECLDKLRPIFEKVVERCEKSKVMAKTITLKMKYFDFEIRSRSKTLTHHSEVGESWWEVVGELLRTPHLPEKPIRLLGISVSQLRRLDEEESQLKLQI